MVYLEDQFSAAGLRILQWGYRSAQQRQLENEAPANQPASMTPWDLLAGVLMESENAAAQALLTYLPDPAPLFHTYRQPFPIANSAAAVAPAATNTAAPTAATASLNTMPPVSLEVTRILNAARELTLVPGESILIGSWELAVGLLETATPIAAALEAAGVPVAAYCQQYHQSRAVADTMLPAHDLELRLSYTPEISDIARIVDANINRLREALRVLEDYVRFVREDRTIATMLKECRHELRETLSFLPPDWLAVARDTERDIGTTISTPAEYFRSDLQAVVAANAKRAQEALRTLEEFAKIERPQLSQQLEQVRYRLYTIDRLLTIQMRARDRLAEVRLYWIVDPRQCVRTLDWMLPEAVAGGVGAVQLRMKGIPDRDLLGYAKQMRQWTRELQVLFIVNDRPDIARIVDADGVHVGQEELPVHAVRKLVGPHLLIGVSSHNVEQAVQAVRDGADYLGVGPVFPSATKDFTELAGLDFVRQVRGVVGIPYFCIGGINETNITAIRREGGRAVAISHCLQQSTEPRQTAATLFHQL